MPRVSTVKREIRLLFRTMTTGLVHTSRNIINKSLLLSGSPLSVMTGLKKDLSTAVRYLESTKFFECSRR